MKKRITVVLEIESEYAEELTEKIVKENILYDLDSVPRSASIVDYKEEAFEQTDKIGGVISANDEKHYWEHIDADYDNMIPNSQYKFYPQCCDRK